MSTALEQSTLPFDAPPVDRIQREFEDYDRRHPEVYAGLVELARQAKSEGRGKYGIEALFVIFRWHRRQPEKDEGAEYKMNDHFTSRYARKIMEENADLRDFFRVRPLKVERKERSRVTSSVRD